MGIEPTYPAWKAGVLPLNYTRIISDTSGILSYVCSNCKCFFNIPHNFYCSPARNLNRYGQAVSKF